MKWLKDLFRKKVEFEATTEDGRVLCGRIDYEKSDNTEKLAKDYVLYNYGLNVVSFKVV